MRSGLVMYYNLKKSEVDPMSLGDILASSTFVGGILGSKLDHI